VFAEMAQVMRSLNNITWERVERESSVHLSGGCAPDKPGNEIVFYADSRPKAARKDRAREYRAAG
jgi:formate dehydrogenase major subunit